MKLCIISNPNSIHTRRWVEWFAQRGHTVWLIADVLPTEHWRKLSNFVLPGRFTPPVIKYFGWHLKTRRILKQLNPDILHAHRVSSAGWLGAASGFHPFVVTPWGSDLYQHPHRSRAAARLARFVLQRADLVTASSQDLCQQAILFGANPHKTHQIGWGVDLSLVKPRQYPAVRTNDGDRTPPVVLSIRAVNPIYNLDSLVKAIPIVLGAYPNAVFIFQQYNVDIDYQTSLTKLIDSLGVGGSVQWSAEANDWLEVLDTYRQATIAISLASTDSMPLSILEAMACGVPVIASDIPAIREWITDQENGLLVDPKDSPSLARGIIHLLSHPEVCAAFREYNIRLVSEHANRQREMERMEKLYQDLLHNRAGGV
jgi:glycosyltransferase involved in cell wall biosynthesis